MAVSRRPPLPYNPPAGYEWVVAPDADWKVADDPTRPCRRSTRRPCPNPTVAALDRRHRHSQLHGPSRRWWHYCADHMYGRWIEDGQVVDWRLRAVQP